MNILLVEDNLAIIDALRLAFRDKSDWFGAVTSIAETKLYIEKHNIDILILDINLPDGNGLEFYRTDIIKRQIPTIFLTAIDDEETIVTGLDLGADDYITKPFQSKN